MTPKDDATGTTAMERRTRLISAEALRDLMDRMLRAAGCDTDAAAIAADVFLEADLRGVGLQGLDHLPTMIRSLRAGKTLGRGKPRIVKKGPAFALVDGGAGPGQVAAVLAADLAAAKARDAGTAAVGVINSGDIFMLAYYTERIARAGLIGFAFSDAPPLVHAHGGIDRVLGTNPMSIAMPTDGVHPLVLDFATSAWGRSRVRQAAYYDEALPDGIGVDEGGRPARRAVELLDGAISPMAGHKGFGLSLCVALLSGPLVGARVGKALLGSLSAESGRPAGKGHLFLAIDPACFGDPAAFRRAASDYIEEIKQSRKAPGVTAIQMPGERAFAARERSLRDGVPIYEVVWNNTAKLAAELGVEMPA
jgi:LDH2 family malate/lactate/ureidoglycolate dehydrogenase